MQTETPSSTPLKQDSKHTTNFLKSPVFISPPLINSANPWATTKEDLLALYSCPNTGAVTIRTSLLQDPFPHDPAIHQYTFFSPTTNSTSATISSDGRSSVVQTESNSLNTLGYSPISLQTYLEIILEIFTSSSPPRTKPFIISITGSASQVASSYKLITDFYIDHHVPVLTEINLSCPNIVDKPPPAYDGAALKTYIDAIRPISGIVPVGIKTPPYTYSLQFRTLIQVLEQASAEGSCAIQFITATNTLGSCLVLDSNSDAVLGSADGKGIGGMAGDALHALALGNVKTIRTMLDESRCEDVRKIEIIGVGGVKDWEGYWRMRNMGATVVGVGTALGREGTDVFGKILGSWGEHDVL